MLGERALGRGENEETVFLRPPGEGERESDRRHLLAGRSGRSLDKANAFACPKRFERLGPGNRGAEKGGIGRHGKSKEQKKNISKGRIFPQGHPS